MAFDFGRNWQQFSEARLNAARLGAALRSLQTLVGPDRLTGKTFLDVGCGSGLFSIAAAQGGACRVIGFDVNSTAVQVCRCNLERLNSTLGLEVEPSFLVGSILDEAFLAELDRSDLVYAWGVLHHTGAMWKAIENAASLVASEQGTFVLAIYNRHWTSPFWRVVKRLYNSAPGGVQRLSNYLFAAAIFLRVWLTTGQNPLHKERGMDFWYDTIDWLGGYPYEYASPAEVERFVTALGFRLESTNKPRGWTGCNEYVFSRAQGARS